MRRELVVHGLRIDRLLLVGRLEAFFRRHDPDLQQMAVRSRRGVELGMDDAAAGAHALDLAGADDAAAAAGILVLKRAVDQM